MDEVGCHFDVVGVPTSGDEHAGGESRRCHEEIDGVTPRASHAVGGGRGGEHGGTGSRPPVALVLDGWPRKWPSDAVHADATVAEQHALWADEAEVPQRHDRGDASSVRRVEHRGGVEREEVLGMDDVEVTLGQPAGDLGMGLGGPPTADGGACPAQVVDPVVAVLEQVHGVPAGSQQGHLLVRRDIFAAGDPVAVVEHEDVHRRGTVSVVVMGVSRTGSGCANRTR